MPIKGPIELTPFRQPCGKEELPVLIRRRELMTDDGTDRTRFDNGKRIAVLMISGGIDSTTLAY